MDFSFSDEQSLLRDSVERFVRSDYTFEARRRLVASELGYSRDNWLKFAELGWLGVPFPEADGGFGGGPVEIMILTEAFGRGLVVEPFVPTVVLGGGLLRAAGNPEQKQRHLAGIIEGSLHVAVAFAEPASRFNLAHVATTATRSGGGFLLHGRKTAVLNAPSANLLIVPARTSGSPLDREGVTLFLVQPDARGVHLRAYPTVDGQRAAELELDHVAIDANAVLGEVDGGLDVLTRVVDEAAFAVGAEAVGCMAAVLEQTVAYTKTRVQFGQPIGKFQVLQHRMVDMFIAEQQARSLMYVAAMRLAEGDGHEAMRTVSAFKAQVGESGRFVGQNAVQLHGGMGMTDELAIGHYFKRLTTIDILFGNRAHHLKRFGSLGSST